jgi:hypothetical protein
MFHFNFKITNRISSWQACPAIFGDHLSPHTVPKFCTLQLFHVDVEQIPDRFVEADNAPSMPVIISPIMDVSDRYSQFS